MGKKKSTPKVNPATDDFNIVIKLGDKTYAGAGKSALDALMAVKKPDKIVGKGFVTLTHGNMKTEQLMWPIRLKRLFYNKYFGAIQAKQLSMAMKPIR